MPGSRIVYVVILGAGVRRSPPWQVSRARAAFAVFFLAATLSAP